MSDFRTGRLMREIVAAVMACLMIAPTSVAAEPKVDRGNGSFFNKPTATATPQTQHHSVRNMIRDARVIVRQSGDGIWPGYSRVTLPVQLIEPTREILFCGRTAIGFKAMPLDRVTGCGLQVRKRQLSVDLAAASYLNEQPVIQIGLPDALGMSRSEWIVTLLHETFHQFQSSLPGYQDAVSTTAQYLGQSGAEWMLDYRFPYADPKVVAAFADMNRCALAFLVGGRPHQVRQLVANYVKARRAARAAVGNTAWQYYEFQVGQEGVARWSELRLARMAGRDDEGIAAVAKDRWAGLSTSLRSMTDQGLGMWKRSSFYVLGAVEAEMLDRLTPKWRQNYIRRPFSLGEQLAAAAG